MHMRRASDTAAGELDLLPGPQRAAVRRLAPLSVAIGLMLAIGGTIRYFAMAYGPEARVAQYHVGGTIHFAILALIAFAMALFSRKSSRPATVLAVGLGYEVVMCFGVGLLDHLIYDMFTPPPNLSFVAVGLLTFPIVIPTTMRRRVLTTLACAAALPASGVVAHLLFDRPAPPLLPIPYIPTLLAAGVALFVARVVHGLSEQASEAQRLGSYDLVERIGGGGMGEVWRARHQRLARPAAVKLINPSMLGDDPTAARRRFDREAQATSALRSPHTVALYDYGVADDGVFYYAMELLDGIDLHRLIETFGPMPAARAAHVLEQVCLSLGEAHESGFIHRDIKPANLCLCRQGSHHDFVKVLDFGLVKELDAAVDATEEGIVRGTPAFMAPESVEGAALDGRTDLYAVGCVAYWLLAGRYVFEGKTPIRMAMHHVQTAPRPLSEVLDGISPELDAVVMACLAKDPADRPADARTLGSMLAALDLGDRWTQDDARRWWNNRRESIEAMMRPGAHQPKTLTPSVGLADTEAVG